MSDEVIASIIGAGSALVVWFLRDVFSWFMKELVAERKEVKSVYKLYADPLTRSVEALFWRLDEVICISGRSAFLVGGKTTSHFAEYKKRSTIYRLAAVLGWIYAFKQELSFSVPYRSSDALRLKQAISQFQSALADGTAIEKRRLERLAELWALALPEDKYVVGITAIAVENVLDEFLDKGDVETADKLPKGDQRELCESVLKLIVRQFKIVPTEFLRTVAFRRDSISIIS